MDRYTDIDQEVCESILPTLVAESESGMDNDLDPEDRKDRAELVSYQDAEGVWHESALKLFDDVEWCGCPGRVAGPARGRDYVSLCYDPWFGSAPIPVHLSYITARAPVDPNEPEPHMPLIPEPAEEQMLLRSTAPVGTKNPKQAAKAERREERAVRREKRQQLRDVLQHIPKGPQRKLVRDALRAQGKLGHDDKDDDE